MTFERAEIVGLQALGFIAGDSQALDGLLNNTGLSPQTLKDAAGEPAVLVGVLDFLLQDEARLLRFCESCELPPDAPARARTALSAEPPHC